jgi:hypothetical protein
MVALICFVLASPFKSNSRLEVENAVLRHQLIILQRKVRDRDRIYGTVVTRRLRAMGIRDSQLHHPRPGRMALPSGDRINPARVLGPRCCFERGTSAPDSKIIRRLLQLRQNASVFAQGCADFPPDSSDRNHSFTPDPRRASPSLRPGLSFRYTLAWPIDLRFVGQYCSDWKIKPDSHPIPKMRETIVAALYWFRERSGRSSKRHCANASGGQRGLRT